MNSDAREERGKVRDSPNIAQRYAVSLLDFCPACASCCFSNYYCLVVNFLFHSHSFSLPPPPPHISPLSVGKRARGGKERKLANEGCPIYVVAEATSVLIE